MTLCTKLQVCDLYPTNQKKNNIFRYKNSHYNEELLLILPSSYNLCQERKRKVKSRNSLCRVFALGKERNILIASTEDTRIDDVAHIDRLIMQIKRLSLCRFSSYPLAYPYPLFPCRSCRPNLAATPILTAAVIAPSSSMPHPNNAAS